MHVTIPSSVTHVEDKYVKSPFLESVTIPSSVTSLGDKCFQDCPNLETVICEMENVVSGSFFNGTPIEVATLFVPEHLVDTYKATAPWSRFGRILPIIVRYEAKGFISFTLELASRKATFDYYRGNVEKVIIPETVIFKEREYEVTRLGDECFSGCSSLISVKIPGSVTSLGEKCFNGCSSLEMITCEMETVESGDFFGEMPIEKATLCVPIHLFDTYKDTAHWNRFGTIRPINALYETDEFTFSVDPATREAFLYKCHGDAKKVIIPEKVTYEGKTYRVTCLGDRCFMGRIYLESVEIPSSVRSIGDSCFSLCSSLTSVFIPASVTSIGDSCFRDCESLETIVVDDENPRYDSRKGCNAIIETCGNFGTTYSVMIAGCKNTFIPSSVSRLGDSCFEGCSSLASIEIPDSVTRLEDWCFSGCSSLASIVIPSSVTDIGSYCFWDCESLASVSIPSSVKCLGDSCFFSCPSLKTVKCRIEEVEEGQFFDGTPIEEATLYVPEHLMDDYKKTEPWSRFGEILPLTVWYETDDAYFIVDLETQEASSEGCHEGVTDFVVPEKVTYEGKEYKVTKLGADSFWGTSSLVSVSIPSSVTALEHGSFLNCPSLVSVYIPSSVTSLGGSCFWGCSSLASIEIPSSVTWLGEYCFACCDSLKTVICRMETVELGSIFHATPIEKATLYVPEHLLDDYKNTEPWSRFGTILPLTEEMENPVK